MRAFRTVHAARAAALLALAVAPVALAAQAAPAAAAFHADRLARLDAWARKLTTDGTLPGVSILLVKNGQVAFEKAYGVRDLGTKAPLRTDDIFRIASQTKAITSVAAMILWEEGKLGLDDPVGMYLPAFKDHTVLTKFNAADSSYEARPTRRKITIRQLLTHTSGLDYADIGSDEFKALYAKAGIKALGAPGMTLGPSIDKLGTLPLRAEPGERWIYSLSLDVLGRVVEVVSGMPLDQFFRTRIFEPLAMRDTWFELPADKRGRLVTLHRWKDDHYVAQHGDTGDAALAESPARKVTYFSGGGGLVSTMRDYARFLQMVVNGGELDGKRLLGRKTVEMMLTNQVGTLQPPFGLGFQLETPASDFLSPKTVGSLTWGGAFNTAYWADPKEKLVALVYAQTFGGPASHNVGGPFTTLVYAALK